MSATVHLDKTCWETPDELFQRWNQRFRFDLDVCAQPHTAKCNRYYVSSRHQLTHHDWHEVDGIWIGPRDGYAGDRVSIDGLQQPWAPFNCWLNPPYGRGIEPWLERAWTESQQGALVVALLPDDQSTRWFHRWVWRKADIWPLEGRVRFVGAKGSPNFGSLIAIYWPKEQFRGCQ